MVSAANGTHPIHQHPCWKLTEDRPNKFGYIASWSQCNAGEDELVAITFRMEFSAVARLNVVILVTFQNAGRAWIQIDGRPVTHKESGCATLDAFDPGTSYSQEKTSTFFHSSVSDSRGEVLGPAYKGVCRIPTMSPGTHDVSIVLRPPISKSETRQRNGTKLKLVSMTSC